MIEVKALEGRFQDADANRRLIASLTDTLCEVLGEELRAETWVVLEGVPRDRWGFGGGLR